LGLAGYPVNLLDSIMKNALNAAMALVLLCGSAAAQPGRPDDRGGRPDDHRGWVDNHRGPRFDERGGHFRYGRGERLPPNYRSFRVDDWRARHLRPPPRGYYWTRVDNDYVLAAAATGVIASVIAASQY